MPFLNIKCQICGKTAISVEYQDLFTTRLHTLNCGHAYTEELVEQVSTDVYDNLESLDGKKPKPFQVAGAKFAEASNIRCLFGDEMRLGKTVQQMCVLKAHPEILPCVVICKSKVKAQYAYEVVRWLGADTLVQIIHSSKDIFIPGMKFYILSFDILRRFRSDICNKCGKISNNKKNKEDEDFLTNTYIECKCGGKIKESNKLIKLFEVLKVKSMIIDECQLVKNTDASRSRELREISKGIEHIMASSGSSIENNAGEYFSILNILKPEKFRSKENFLKSWCDYYWNGFNYKIGGIRKPQDFKEFTKDFIIRRTRKEVASEIKEVERQFQMVELEDENLGKAYNQMNNDLIDYAENNSDSSFEEASNIMAMMAKMRHNVGLQKIPAIIEYVEEFLMNTDRKLTIFVHHKDVGQILSNKIDDLIALIGGVLPVTRLTADVNNDNIQEIIYNFGNNPQHRIMVASTLSSAEGLTFGKWSDGIIAEQQWNPMKEKQAEDRFVLLDKTDQTYATYFILIGTIDEYLAELKEQKRAYVSSAVDFQESDWEDSAVIKQLTEKIVAVGKKKWSMK